jgi:DNA-binding CsgD family transcriptional regulator
MTVAVRPMSTPLTMREIASNWQISCAGGDTLSASLETLCRQYGGDGAILFKIRASETKPEGEALAAHSIDPVLADAVIDRATQAVAGKGHTETLPMMIPAWRIGGASAFIYAFPACPKAHGQLVIACLSVEQKPFAAIAEMYLASRCIMEGADALPGVKNGGDQPRISTREQSCLAWTAEGKTSEEIGIILDLSPHTVNHYLGSAARKLGASNRMHAVAKALRLGLIERPV